MKIKGIDNGYSYTKVVGNNERLIFKSAYSTSDKVVSGTSHLSIDNKDYYVGVGKMIFDPDKTNHEINMVTTLYSLAQSGNDEYFLVVGLPIGQYSRQKESLKESILNYNKRKVYYKDNPLNFKINDVTVYLQGAAPLYTLNRTNGEYIILDIGGYTIDIALINMMYGKPTILKHSTSFTGITTLYNKIAEIINNKYGLTLLSSDVEKILVNGLKIDGKEIDLTFLTELYNSYLDELLVDFNRDYNAHTTDIYLCGGDARLFYPMLKNEYPHILLIPDYQFANANGYYAIGIQKYYKYITNSIGRR